MTSPNLDATVSIAKALGHPARVRALAMLRSGELCVCQITAVLELATSTVSLHLRELKRCGLITERRSGRWVHISLAEDPEVTPWIDLAVAGAAADQRLAGDLEKVAELRQLPTEDLCRLGYEAAKARAEAARAGEDDTAELGGCG
jgi:DNA-binding transcriptional ArsR family regulator